MTRARLALALVAIFATLTTTSADDKNKPATKLLGRWALPGKTKQRWEFHADGTVTGTADGKMVFHPAGSSGPHLTYTLGAIDEEGNAELTLTLRPTGESSGEGVFKAKVEFTRQGRFTLKYTQKPADADRFPLPLPDGKKLYRPEDVTE